ncbi:MAG: hypothetical protein ACLVL7_10355 [Anaerotruncus massiliensis (ex Togo et al. 2019)]
MTNLVRTLEELKSAVWIYGAEAGGGRWEECDLTGPAALVIASRVRPSRLVRETAM